MSKFLTIGIAALTWVPSFRTFQLYFFWTSFVCTFLLAISLLIRALFLQGNSGSLIRQTGKGIGIFFLMILLLIYFPFVTRDFSEPRFCPYRLDHQYDFPEYSTSLYVSGNGVKCMQAKIERRIPWTPFVIRVGIIENWASNVQFELRDEWAVAKEIKVNLKTWEIIQNER